MLGDLFGLRHRLLLEHLLAGAGQGSVPTGVPQPVRAQLAGLDVVRDQHVGDVEHPAPKLRVQDGAGHLHPPLCVPGHKVGGGEEQVRVLPPAKAVDPGVLQIAAHHGEHGDAVGQARDPGTQAADSPHIHHHLHPGLGGLGQLVDELPVGDGVQLQENIPPVPLRDLPVNELDAPVPQLIGGNQQALVCPLQVGGGQILEQRGGVRPQLRPGGHQAQVGVLPGGLFVVVARPHLGDVLEPPPLPPGDQADLGVDLDVLRTVEDGASRLLHPLGPLDVVLLVKAGPQFHQDGDFLSIFGGCA